MTDEEIRALLEASKDAPRNVWDENLLSPGFAARARLTVVARELARLTLERGERITELEADVAEARTQGVADYAESLVSLLRSLGATYPDGLHGSVEQVEAAIRSLARQRDNAQLALTDATANLAVIDMVLDGDANAPVEEGEVAARVLALREERDVYRAALDAFAEGDCSYDDGCPATGTRHGQCDTCRAREALRRGAGTNTEEDR